MNATPPQPPPKASSDLNSWQSLVRSRTAVLGLLFLVTGILGLPLLWTSPVFGRSEKWLWTIVVAVYTAMLFTATAAICLWAWNSLTQSMR